MLKSWTPGEEPDKDEMKVQLEKTRKDVYKRQVLTEYGHELLENFCCIAEKFNKNE